MKKYFLIAAVIHSFFFIHTNNKNTLGNPDSAIKRNIPVSYNIKSDTENTSGIKAEIVSQEKTQEAAEEKAEPLKKEETKPVPEFESRMTKNKKEKDIKKEKTKDKKAEQKQTEKQNKNSENNSSKNKAGNIEENGSFIENSDGTYTAVSSKGIDFKILKEVSPNYPRQAETVRYSKTVTVEAKFLVGTDGSIEEVQIIKSHEKFGFDKEVISALKKWKFKPVVYKGKNIKVYFTKEFIFTPKQ